MCSRVFVLSLALVLALPHSALAQDKSKEFKEFQQYQRWKKNQKQSKPVSSNGSPGPNWTKIGGIGLGVTYLATLGVGLAGPSSSSSDYVIPVIGPFMQAGKVRSPYKALNLVSGIAQSAFLITFLVGLASDKGEERKPSQYVLIPDVNPEKVGMRFGLSF